MSATIGSFILDLGENQNDPAIIGIAFEETERNGIKVVEATVVNVGNVETVSVNYEDDTGTARTESMVFGGNTGVGDRYVLCEGETSATKSFCSNANPAADQGKLRVIGKNVDSNAISVKAYT